MKNITSVAFYFSIITFLFSCSGKKPDPVDLPLIQKLTWRIDKINLTAESGAVVEQQFIYKDSLPQKVLYRNLSGNDSMYYQFNYTGTELTSLENYRYTNTTIPQTKFLLFYSNNRVSKIEFWVYVNGGWISNSYITYRYDTEGRLIEKVGWNNLANSVHTYSYANGNINLIQTAHSSGTDAIEFSNSYSGYDNLFFKNNHGMNIFLFYLFTPNYFLNGFLESYIGSKNILSSTVRTYNNNTLTFQLPIFPGSGGNWGSIGNYADVYNSGYRFLFQKMSFTYKEMP